MITQAGGPGILFTTGFLFIGPKFCCWKLLKEPTWGAVYYLVWGAAGAKIRPARLVFWAPLAAFILAQTRLVSFGCHRGPCFHLYGLCYAAQQLGSMYGPSFFSPESIQPPRFSDFGPDHPPSPTMSSAIVKAHLWGEEISIAGCFKAQSIKKCGVSQWACSPFCSPAASDPKAQMWGSFSFDMKAQYVWVFKDVCSRFYFYIGSVLRVMIEKIYPLLGCNNLVGVVCFRFSFGSKACFGVSFVSWRGYAPLIV
ncbi:putative cytochrome P450 [Helianthus anomalus]